MGRAVTCLLWVLLVAAPVYAAPVTYSWVAGEATVTATTDPGGVTVLGSTLLPVDGVFVTFDDAAIDLTNLLITIPTSGIIGLDTPYGGYDQFRIESAAISPGVGFATYLPVDNGGGNYSFFAYPLNINGVYSAFDSTLTNPDMLNIPVPFTDNFSGISGTININTGTLTLSGITLAHIPGAVFGEINNDLSIKADIVFVGGAPIPEPSSALLFGLGLLGLASSRRRNFLK